MKMPEALDAMRAEVEAARMKGWPKTVDADLLTEPGEISRMTLAQLNDERKELAQTQRPPRGERNEAALRELARRQLAESRALANPSWEKRPAA